MLELFTLLFIATAAFLAPGIIASSYIKDLKIYDHKVFGAIEFFAISLAINILFVYILFFFDINNPTLISIYAAVAIALMLLTLISNGTSARIMISPIATLFLALLAIRVLPDIGLPIMAWDGIQVWQKMADQMLVGEARVGTATYPHGLGALGALAMAINGALEGQFALRALTVFMPIIALAAILAFTKGAQRIVAGLFTTIFIMSLLNGMDGISFKYGTSFTSDMFLFTATIISFLAIYKFADEYKKRSDWSWDVLLSPSYVVSVLGIFVAANAKQTGLSYILLPGLVAVGFAPTHQSLLSRLGFATLLTIAPTVMGLLWYALAFVRDVGASGGAGLEFLIVGVHRGRDLFERADLAMSQMVGLLPLWVWLISVSLAILGSLSRRGLLTILAIAPTFLFYLFVSGYAVRNSTGVIAGVFLLAFLGLVKIYEWAEPRMANFEQNTPSVQAFQARTVSLTPSVSINWLVAALVISIGTLGFTSGSALIAYLDTQNARGGPEIGFSGINTRLIRNSPPTNGEPLKLVTNYVVAERIPQLSQFDVAQISGRRGNILRETSGDTRAFILFYIWPDRSSTDFQEYLRCLVDSDATEDLGTLWDGRGTQYVHILVETMDAQRCE